MSTVTPQSVVTRAQQLFETLNAAEAMINQLNGADQLNAMEIFNGTQLELTELQQLVNSTANRLHFDDIDAVIVSENLSSSVEILQRLGNTQDLLLELFEMTTAASLALASQDHTEIRSLAGRVQHMISTRTDLTEINLAALLQLSDELQNPQLLVPAPRAQSPVSAPRQDSPSAIMAAQDVEYRQALFADQLHEQFQALEVRETQVHEAFGRGFLEDFDALLSLYKDVKQFSFNRDSCAFRNAGQRIDRLLRETEQTLSGMILQRSQVEEEAAAQSTGAINPAFGEMKNAIVELIAAKANNQLQQVSVANAKIQPAYMKLSETEKKTLLAAFSGILKDARLITADLSDVTISLAFSMWGSIKGATWEQRKQALEKVLANAPAQAAPVQALAVNMKERMQEAMNMQPVAVVRANPQNSVAAPEAEEIDVEEFKESIGIQTLQLLLPLLSENATMIQLQEANEALFIMESQDTKCIFQMSENNSRSVSSRPDFHLYFMHKNEAPEQLIADNNYGHKAFIGEFTATNAERTRAVQRTLVEVALQNLEETLPLDDCRNAMLDVLEATKLDVKDRAKDQTCAAYNLFGVFYNLHVEARKTDASLIDPNDHQFQSDFGRHGFSRNMPGISNEVKLAAIAQVRADLKAAWKL